MLLRLYHLYESVTPAGCPVMPRSVVPILMPELPEVETMVRGIRPVLEGRTLIDFVRMPCPRKPLSLKPGLAAIRQRANGQAISAVRRRAKRVVIELESGAGFVIEPRMTGLMLVSDPPTREHLRFAWQVQGLRGVETVLFWDRRGLGTVQLLGPDDLTALMLPGRLGPDALEMTPALWRETLARTRRPIKVALLDQGLVAGIGNLYASEILHRSRIAPSTPASEVSGPGIRRLAEAVETVLQLAIRHEGSTLSDGTYRNALNQDGGYQNSHQVYDRAGRDCPRCGKTILRIVQAQRSTFYCAGCQR
ncbi:Formamidopyrimidine-DNA glycosylase [Caulifigura coniformis]|uniref:Formamidopyrimidine-DNA glycosylase n=1 Tax=Caulifigura coniformis TaxID=2527983 RepID=A0A517SB79_9PLAN|nr:bifunctional DNA-formamidopyrimidine glycosylase/DNA-(apurinic or apyrimidinic site) lyase [Caulifigura coniformis]QDT53369.1 Formamidopyrimidine-DNA glycosylase [Caulifigura coniformis]